MRRGVACYALLCECAFKQVTKSTAGQAGSGTQETDLTLLIAHSYESLVKKPPLSGSTYGVAWRGDESPLQRWLDS